MQAGANAAPGGDLVVVGAGILGASVAYHAAQAGAVVTLVDAGRPGAGVTAGSFGWVRTVGASPGPGARLRSIATAQYRRLEAELPGLPVTWSGSLTWGVSDSAPTAGPGQQLVDGDAVATLEPAVRRPPTWALWAPGDGAVDPVGVTELLVEAARARGARVSHGTPVIAIRRDAAGRVVGVETTAGFVSGGRVVLAAGVATAALGASVGVRIPVEPSPATLFRFRAPAGLVRSVVNTPDFDLRQVSPDGLVAAADSPDRTLAAIRSTFRGATSVELIGTQVSDRPMPIDGEPIIGPVTQVPGLYAAVLHAAVMLAPAVGRLVAREVGDGYPEPSLEGCRLDRFPARDQRP